MSRRSVLRKEKYAYISKYAGSSDVPAKARDWSWETIRKYVRVRNFYQDHDIADKARKKSWQSIEQEFFVTKPKRPSRIHPKKYQSTTKERREYRQEILLLKEIGRLSPEKARYWMKRPAKFRDTVHTPILNERGFMSRDTWRAHSNRYIGFPPPMEKMAETINEREGLEVNSRYGYAFLYWRWVKGKEDDDIRAILRPVHGAIGYQYVREMVV
jgi:hypothetical protein